MKRILALTAAALLAAAPLSLRAEDDCGLQLTAGATYKINKKWNVGLEAEMRSRNAFRTFSRWSLGAEGSYKPWKFLKVSAAYYLLYDNNPEKFNYDDLGAVSNWRPSYWGLRHRVNVSLTGNVGWGRFSFSLRERWQYTYRPRHEVQRFDMQSEAWETRLRSSSAKNLLRSRLQVEYNIPRCKVDPYVSAEFYTTTRLEKTRLVAGADWSINKKNALGAFYRYEIVSGDHNMNTLGIQYKFKF